MVETFQFIQYLKRALRKYKITQDESQLLQILTIKSQALILNILKCTKNIVNSLVTYQSRTSCILHLINHDLKITLTQLFKRKYLMALDLLQPSINISI